MKLGGGFKFRFSLGVGSRLFLGFRPRSGSGGDLCFLVSFSLGGGAEFGFHFGLGLGGDPELGLFGGVGFGGVPRIFGSFEPRFRLGFRNCVFLSLRPRHGSPSFFLGLGVGGCPEFRAFGGFGTGLQFGLSRGQGTGSFRSGESGIPCVCGSQAFFGFRGSGKHGFLRSSRLGNFLGPDFRLCIRLGGEVRKLDFSAIA